MRPCLLYGHSDHVPVFGKEICEENYTHTCVKNKSGNSPIWQLLFLRARSLTRLEGTWKSYKWANSSISIHTLLSQWRITSCSPWLYDGFGTILTPKVVIYLPLSYFCLCLLATCRNISSVKFHTLFWPAGLKVNKSTVWGKSWSCFLCMKVSSTLL